MSVTEVVMKPGSWSLRLRAGTPKSIRDYLRLESVGFGHVVITPIRLADHTLSWAGLLAVSRYTGVLRSRPSEYDIGGPGPVMWIGDEDGKSDSVGDGPTPLSLVGASFATWISNLRPAALTAGSVEAAPGSCTCTFRWANRRVALDQIVAFFGREYRVNPNLTLDAGLESYLYATATTPAAVVQPLSGGRESGVIGVHATSLDAAKDLDDYTTSVVVLGPNAVGSAAISPATSYKDGQGNAVVLDKVATISEVPPGGENAAATAEMAKHQALRRGIQLSSDAYDIGADIACGDTIYVWDPDRDLYDQANQVQYRGRLIFPLKARVYGKTWSVRRGMGVYFRDGVTGTITDLTDYIEFETGDTTLDVGATKRQLFDTPTGPGALSLPPGALPTPWADYSPLIVQNISRGRTVNSARYMQIGKVVHAQPKVTMTAAGSANQLLIQLPVPAKTANTLIGRGVVYLAGPATPIDCEMYGFGGDLNYAFFIADGAPANGAFATALAIGDVVTAKLDYEAA